MNKTEINWTELSWNPASGCTPISAGCRHCYARRIAEPKRGSAAFPRGFDVTLRPKKLAEPARVERPSLVFTNSMTDMFHSEIPDAYRDRILEAMRETPRHRYQVLTKRVEAAERYFSTRRAPACMWLGATVEHAATAGRVDVLRRIDAPVRFLSIEPMLGPLPDLDLAGIHWVIVGGESGHQLCQERVRSERALVRRGDRKAGERCWEAREDRVQWVRDVRDACSRQGVAFWFKQWGGSRGLMAGRLLDGRTHDGMPTHVPGAMPGADYSHRADRRLSLTA
jgi:protein gp37